MPPGDEVKGLIGSGPTDESPDATPIPLYDDISRDYDGTESGEELSSDSSL